MWLTGDLWLMGCGWHRKLVVADRSCGLAGWRLDCLVIVIGTIQLRNSRTSIARPPLSLVATRGQRICIYIEIYIYIYMYTNYIVFICRL